MSLIRSKGNRNTELVLAALLRANGVTGWRRHGTLRIQAGRTKPEGRSGRATADFVFRRERVAVFVDGCFWHRCPRHGTMPAGNRAFWKAKLERNVARDRRVSRGLRKAGWKVLRIWECALSARRRPAAMKRIVRALALPQAKEGRAVAARTPRRR